jgi:hypothetical protein
MGLGHPPLLSAHCLDGGHKKTRRVDSLKRVALALAAFITRPQADIKSALDARLENPASIVN